MNKTEVSSLFYYFNKLKKRFCCVQLSSCVSVGYKLSCMKVTIFVFPLKQDKNHANNKIKCKKYLLNLMMMVASHGAPYILCVSYNIHIEYWVQFDYQ